MSKHCPTKWGLAILIMIAVSSGPAVVRAADEDVKAELQALRKEFAEYKAQQQQKSQTTTEISKEEIQKLIKEMASDANANGSEFKVVWKDGVWLQSNDGRFDFHVGGEFAMDWGWISGPKLERTTSPTTDFTDGLEFRYMRLKAEGTMYKYVQFKIEEDFAGDSVVLKDAYIKVIEIPILGSIQAGNFKEPFSMDQLESDQATFFMERSLADNLVPARNPGIMASNAFLGEPKRQRMTVAAGFFRQEAIGDQGPAVNDGTVIASDRGYAGTARVTGLPWYENKGEQLVHVGFDYSHRGTNDTHTLDYRARPEAHFTSYRYIDTGTVNNVESEDLYAAELAAVFGPVAFQSEYIGAYLNSDKEAQFNPSNSPDHNPCFNAYYAQVSYMITGETRPYNNSNGTFDRVRPKKNFREDGGWGAWEVALRYSYLDLDDSADRLGGSPSSGITRGEMNDVTIGVNWYLNPNARIQWNYVRSCPDRIGAEGGADIFMMRFFFDF